MHTSLLIGASFGFTSQVAIREFTFVYANANADSADTRLRASEVLNIAPPDGNAAPEIEDLVNELRPRVVAIRRDRCNYEYSDRLIGLAGEYGLQKLARTNRLQLPEDLTIGDLTVRDLRAFWAALMAISDIHTVAHWIADDGLLDDLPINTIVLCKPLAEFTQLIARISGLAVDAVNYLLNIFTYDVAIADRVPILQPLLPVDNDRLCLPTSFVNGNSFERNFRKLLHHHPRLREFVDEFESDLEPAALRTLSDLFPHPRFTTVLQLQIPNVTDVDVLVFDLDAGFALVIEHKWLIAPDTLRESISNDEKLARGSQQATRSCQYLRDHHDYLRDSLGLPRNQEINTIEGVVVSRGLEPTGFQAMNHEIPIVTERAFTELRTQTDGLPRLWELLMVRPDHDRAEARAADIRSVLSLGGYEFVLPGMAVAMDRNEQ